MQAEGEQGTNPGNYCLRRGTLGQELRSVCRPLKRGDLPTAVRTVAPAMANLWNHYLRGAAPPRFLCSCCGAGAHAFVHLGNHQETLWNHACPSCDSRGRHRGLALLLPKLLADRPGVRRILHFAPEAVLSKVLNEGRRVEYHTTDLRGPDCDFPGEDIQRLRFRDGEYDLVVCNQVIEHVPDDRAAICEISRIISPDGLAVITVPCDWREARTQEFRRVRPGGHYRHYGRDFADRLGEAFESVEVFDLHTLDAAPTGLSYGIRKTEMAFLCTRPTRGAHT